jgi:hypothetical protein
MNAWQRSLLFVAAFRRHQYNHQHHTPDVNDNYYYSYNYSYTLQLHATQLKRPHSSRVIIDVSCRAECAGLCTVYTVTPMPNPSYRRDDCIGDMRIRRSRAVPQSPRFSE